ncbi:MAG TPA: hypothetical protein PK072_08480 [Quisquiliibacterium sp.]|nr:hypothetical protein [Quisquiliibacterium sp.]HQP66672.1 hypothetical protein [Quisquiliibacterium sp.]
MTALFLSALLLGFVFNAAPGAVFAKTIRLWLQGTARDAASGAPVGRAASAADMGADDRALGHVR